MKRLLFLILLMATTSLAQEQVARVSVKYYSSPLVNSIYNIQVELEKFDTICMASVHYQVSERKRGFFGNLFTLTRPKIETRDTSYRINCDSLFSYLTRSTELSLTLDTLMFVFYHPSVLKIETVFRDSIIAYTLLNPLNKSTERGFEPALKFVEDLFRFSKIQKEFFAAEFSCRNN